MLYSLISILAVVGCVCGSPMANQYFDSLLNTALRNQIRMQGLDPAALPIFITKFEDKVAIIGKVKGQADYNNGTLTGLSNVRRYSECQGPYYSYGAKSVNCTIVFDKMSILYDGKLKYGKMPKVNIKARSDITTSLVFVEISQTGYNPSLKNFLYQQTGWQQVKHTGLGPLNKFMKILDDAFKQHIQAVIFNLMSQRFQNALNAAASQIPLPN